MTKRKNISTKKSYDTNTGNYTYHVKFSYHNNKVVKCKIKFIPTSLQRSYITTGIAKCSNEDTYNQAYGEKLALERAISKLHDKIIKTEEEYINRYKNNVSLTISNFDESMQKIIKRNR